MRRSIAVVILLLNCAYQAPLAWAGSPIRLKSGVFEPLQDSRPSAAALRGLSDAGGAWILQHEGPITGAWRQAIERAGGRVVGYLPDDAYLIRATPEQARELSSLEGTRWMGSYRPADRVDPLLVSRLSLLSRQPDVGLEVLTFRDEPGAGLVDHAVGLARKTGTALVAEQRSVSGRQRLLLSVPGRHLAAVVESLAGQPALEWLTLAPRLRPLNDDAVWICQSDVDPATPLFDQGLTGVGQIIGIADTGVDTSACQFRFDGAQLTQANSTRPPDADATDPSAKIVSYYEIPGSEAYDHAVFLFHGSRVAGSALGDDNGSLASRSAPFTPGRDAADGMAPGAQLVVQDIGTSFGTLTGFLDQAALHQQAYDTEVLPDFGVRVHVDAYGFDPPAGYSGESAALDETLWRLRDYSAVFAAGNWGEVDPASCDPAPCDPWDGASSLSGLGAVAKNTVTVGASGNPGAAGENRESVVVESARGPSLEGLLKPDVMAPGHNLSALGDADPVNDNCGQGRLSIAGTSMAAGTMGGLAALVRQYFTDGYYPDGARQRMDPACDDGSCDPEVFNPSNALVKAVLVNAARSMTGELTGDTNTDSCPGPRCSAPSYGQGWGRVALGDALHFPGDQRTLMVLTDTWNGATAAASVAGRGESPKAAIVALEAHNFAFSLGAGSGGPLKVTLVWSDPAASPAAASSLVNDLDLQLTYNPGDCAPASTLHYLGNDFHPDQPWSVDTSSPLSQGADRLNPVEQVVIESPQAGSYSVRVTGFNVPGNGESDVPAQPEVPDADTINSWEQGYALIVTGTATTPLVPPCPIAAGDPRVGCVDTGVPPGMEVELVSFCGVGTPECPDCTPEWYRWDFDDGNTEEGPALANTSHTYTVGGLYYATLTVCEAGLEGRNKVPVEVIAGTTDMPVALGNSILMRKNPLGTICGDVSMFWEDVPVPDATGYNSYEFDAKPKLPSVPPDATKVNASLFLHGTTNDCFDPSPAPPNGVWFYQVRGVNCNETLVGP